MRPTPTIDTINTANSLIVDRCIRSWIMNNFFNFLNQIDNKRPVARDYFQFNPLNNCTNTNPFVDTSHVSHDVNAIDSSHVLLNGEHVYANANNSLTNPNGVYVLFMYCPFSSHHSIINGDTHTHTNAICSKRWRFYSSRSRSVYKKNVDFINSSLSSLQYNKSSQAAN